MEQKRVRTTTCQHRRCFGRWVRNAAAKCMNSEYRVLLATADFKNLSKYAIAAKRERYILKERCVKMALLIQLTARPTLWILEQNAFPKRGPRAWHHQQQSQSWSLPSRGKSKKSPKTKKLGAESSSVQQIAFQVGKRVPKHGFEPLFWTHCACVNYLLATLKRIRTQSDWTNVPNLRRSPLCSKKVKNLLFFVDLFCRGQKF